MSKKSLKLDTYSHVYKITPLPHMRPTSDSFNAKIIDCINLLVSYDRVKIYCFVNINIRCRVIN